MKTIDSNKVKFIKGLSTENYSLYYTYNRIDEVQEVIRGHYGLPSKDTPKAIKVSGIDGFLFMTKNSGILVDYFRQRYKKARHVVYGVIPF